MMRTKGAWLRPLGVPYGLALPSSGASPDADLIRESLAQIKLKRYSPGSAPQARQARQRSLAERLYDALAAAKVMTAEVAMHLDQGWRDGLFAQLDDLLDIEDWHEDDEPLLAESLETFLRMILYLKPERRPGLGLSHEGHLIAAWTEGADRLTLEFLPADIIRWTLFCETDGQPERAVGENIVTRLPKVLSPYRAGRWFTSVDRSAP